MKKRLLITSIVMMLVVAVALSTATYAWFTQNATVSASTVTMTASTANAQSISIAWLGSETKTTSINTNGGATVDPMCPTTLSDINASTIAFNTQYIGSNGKFIGAGTSATPYTYTDGQVSAFYINNDSNSQAVKITVSATTIANGAAITPLASGTLLEAGKTYYKNNNGTWSKLTAGESASWENGTYVANQTTATGDSGDFVAYATRGVEEYVRIAVFASGAKTQAEGLAITSAAPLAETAYGYKGLISKTPGNNVTNGAITASPVMGPSDLATGTSTGTVDVIANLPALNRVYVIVKVWLDGADFTEHEGNQTATVNLQFSASNVTQQGN